MKIYLAEKVFRHEGFPLMVTYAPQRASMPPHRHDFIEIVLIGQGHSIHSVETGEGGEFSYGLIQGDVFSIMPGETHKYSESKHLVVYNLALHKEIIAGEMDELARLSSWAALFSPKPGARRDKIHLPLSERLAAERCLKKIILELSLGKSGFKLNAKIALLEFLVIAARSLSLPCEASGGLKSSSILEAISAMEAFPEKPFHLEAFAQVAAMSVSSFTKKFREATGLSPLDYFLGARLEKVHWLLAETTLSMAEIAFTCGFCDTSYMIKLFRAKEGVTPGKYRSLVRCNPSLDVGWNVAEERTRTPNTEQGTSNAEGKGRGNPEPMNR